MKLLYPNIGLERLCRLFGKSRQAFYDHSWRQSNEQLKETLIIEMVKSIRLTLPRVGAVKLLVMLQPKLNAHQISIGRDSFFELLRKNNLLVKTRRRYVRTTMSDHHYKKWPDLVKGVQIDAANKLWVSDITYLTTKLGFVYLSLITDQYSHKIVGYHLSQNLKAQGCLIALNKAITTLPANALVIHHSDRGIQYCCDLYVSRLLEKKIRISMTQSGSPYDNAVAERTNGILKTELQLDKTFNGYKEAVLAVHNAIDAYNRIRPHMSISNLTPQKAHEVNMPLIKKWKPKKYVKQKPYHCKVL